MPPLVFERRVPLRATRQAVWPLLRNTDRLNLAIGSSRLRVEPIDEGGTLFRMHGTNAGFPLTWVEPPYRWVEGEELQFERHYANSPMAHIAVRYAVEDAPGGGTIVTLRWSITPRWWLARPVVWLVATLQFAKLVAYAASFDDAIAGGVPPAVPPAQLDRARAERVGTGLVARFGEGPVRRLVDHLERGTDLEVQAIRPFELAASWDAAGDEVLKLCLAATKEGLLELRWAVLCPSCTQASETLPSLRDLEADGAHCHTCDIRFGLELDRAVEAVFEPHRAIRVIDRRPMCVAGPMLTPHVVAQAFAERGAVVLAVPPEAGRYRAFARGGASTTVDVVEGAATSGAITVDGDQATPTAMTVAPGAAIEVRFEDGAPRHAKLERVEWTFRAATAHHVSMIPEFRALFGSEALREGLALRVARTTILFSDLCGSTALYSKVGDAAAFGVVTDCLTYGRDIVERHGGVVIKTMGDAVMAAFPDPEAAVRAGAAMILEWDALRAGSELLRELDVKVGVFGGPCTVVSANGVLDYFGQTVNSAARVQHLAGPRELLVPEAIAAEVVAPEGTRYGEPFGARVKGIDDELVLRRCRVAEV